IGNAAISESGGRIQRAPGRGSQIGLSEHGEVIAVRQTEAERAHGVVVHELVLRNVLPGPTFHFWLPTGGPLRHLRVVPDGELHEAHRVRGEVSLPSPGRRNLE